MEEYPRDLVLLMDELSPIDFCKLAFYKLSKIKLNTINELEELEKVMCKAMDLSTKMKLGMLSPALRDRFFKVLTEKGLDKPPSLLANIALEHSKLPSSNNNNRGSPALYVEENQPKLFQNTSKPADVDPNSYKPLPKANSPKRDQDPYKSGMLELDSIKQGQPNTRQNTYRDESPSPPRAYRARSQSRPRDREPRRSRSPPPYKRSSSRPRRSRSRSPPSVRSYSRFDDRRSKSPPSSRSYSRRSRSPPSVRSRRSRSPPSVRSRRSRSPPSVRSRRSRSPPSVRSRRSPSPPSVRGVPKEEDDDREEEGGARKGGLSFSLAPRKKVPVMEKPSFKFT